MKKLLFSLLLLVLAIPAWAQDDERPPEVRFTFRGLRLINGQSTETLPQGHLNFSVAHRFSPIDGVQNFFGMDGTSNFRLGLGYGLTDDLAVGVGRSRLGKRYDGWVKYKLLKQRYGGFPFTAALLLGGSIGTESLRPGQEDYFVFDHRLAYHSQLLLARKLGRLSLQLAPTLVHRNLVDYAAENNTLLAMGAGARWQFNSRFGLAVEYYYRLNPGTNPVETYRNPLAISLDMETAQHRFQLQFTNAFSLLETGFISQTLSDPLAGQVRFGFNISRNFGMNR